MTQHTPGDTVTAQVVVHDSEQAVDLDASPAPVVTVVRNAVDSGVGTLTQITTGLYKAQGTLGAGWIDSDDWQIRVDGYIGGKLQRGIVAEGVISTKRAADIFTLIETLFAGITSVSAWLRTLFTTAEDPTAATEIGNDWDSETDSPQALAPVIESAETAATAAQNAAEANQETLDDLTEDNGGTDRLTAAALGLAPTGSGGGGGGTQIVYMPATRETSLGAVSPLTCTTYVAADFSRGFVFSGDLTAGTYTFAVQTPTTTFADFAPAVSYDAATNLTTITPTIARDNHVAPACYQYALRSIDDGNQPIARGDYVIRSAPDASP